jgi:hypothetical protein
VQPDKLSLSRLSVFLRIVLELWGLPLSRSVPFQIRCIVILIICINVWNVFFIYI